MEDIRTFIGFLLIIILSSIILPSPITDAQTLSTTQKFAAELTAELNEYFRKNPGTIRLQYNDLTTKQNFQIKGKTPGLAASTIKLPLAIFVMELATTGKINLNEKLIYKKQYYIEGSGVIRYQKVGSSYTIRDLVKKSIIYSDNIAYLMLRDKVGKTRFIHYLNHLGAENHSSNGNVLTSPNDLTIYAKKLYDFSQRWPLGKELVGYLKSTIYNTTIPSGIKGVQVAHKVGMFPNLTIYNDIGIVYDTKPFTLAIMTKGFSYEKSQRVIADIAGIVYKHHKHKSAPIAETRKSSMLNSRRFELINVHSSL